MLEHFKTHNFIPLKKLQILSISKNESFTNMVRYSYDLILWILDTTFTLKMGELMTYSWNVYVLCLIGYFLVLFYLLLT